MAAPWTIGVGHTGPEVHEGLEWTDAQVDAAYASDLGRRVAADSLANVSRRERLFVDERTLV